MGPSFWPQVHFKVQLLKRVGSLLCTLMEGILAGRGLAQSALVGFLENAAVMFLCVVWEGMERRAFVSQMMAGQRGRGLDHRGGKQEQASDRCAGKQGLAHTKAE